MFDQFMNGLYVVEKGANAKPNENVNKLNSSYFVKVCLQAVADLLM